MAKFGGEWRGRLVDAAGFEGTVTLDMRGRGGKVSGRYHAALFTQHGDAGRKGKLAGRMEDGKISLTLRPERDNDPKIELRGTVFPMGKGMGLKGIYEIEQRKFSPLVRGVMCACNNWQAALPETRIENPQAGRRKAKAPR